MKSWCVRAPMRHSLWLLWLWLVVILSGRCCLISDGFSWHHMCVLKYWCTLLLDLRTLQLNRELVNTFGNRGKKHRGKKAQFKGLENIILRLKYIVLSPLCLCCWSLCATVIIVTRNYNCHRCILMRNCWAENNFLVMSCICTSLDAQNGCI